ncbi:MAG: molybdopterin-guanine dinucleotide biosynthesis protein B [Rhizobiaceae bacterium]|nr:molybdopterin-guanine dinucleotide biosynthesis protein B [Rhizobiaceae bacterium]
MTQKVFGISGWKNSGKTTLTSAVIKELTARGLRISSVKHAHHNVDVDQEGTDSFKHRISGASEVMLASSKRFALMHEIGGSEEEWSLDQLLEKMSAVDLILVEGFKSSNIPKIQTIRKASLENEGMGQMNNIVAYAADMPIETYLPVLEIDDVVKVADFIIKYLNINVS